MVLERLRRNMRLERIHAVREFGKFESHDENHPFGLESRFAAPMNFGKQLPKLGLTI
jgi:hypothetical protein